MTAFKVESYSMMRNKQHFIPKSTTRSKIIRSFGAFVFTAMISFYAMGQTSGNQDRKIVGSFEEFKSADDSPLFKIRSVNAGVGYYHPAFDFWNDNTPWKLGGALLPSIAAEISIKKLLITRFELGFFQATSSLTRVSTFGQEDFSVAMVPFSAGIYYPAIIGSRENVLVTIGGGISLISISHSYKSALSDQMGTGSTTIPFVSVGADYSLGRYSIGLEGRYSFGDYTHTIQLDPLSEPVTTDVDISGPYAGLNLKYLF